MNTIGWRDTPLQLEGTVDEGLQKLFMDTWTVFHAGRSHYARLLRGGVRIYEGGQQVMHSKTASIDGICSTMGSTNLDWRSFLHNDELNAAILGEILPVKWALCLPGIWRSPMPSISIAGSTGR